MRLCGVEDCDRKHEARGFCRMHWKRWRRTGSPEGSPMGRKMEVRGYDALHAALRYHRGSASSHPCHDCGSPAATWSYDGTDPEFLIGFVKSSVSLLRYSLDFDRYQPRCRPCHAHFDRVARLSEPTGQ